MCDAIPPYLGSALPALTVLTSLLAHVCRHITVSWLCSPGSNCTNISFGALCVAIPPCLGSALLARASLLAHCVSPYQRVLGLLSWLEHLSWRTCVTIPPCAGSALVARASLLAHCVSPYHRVLALLSWLEHLSWRIVCRHTTVSWLCSPS